jgi:hypothetical protein
MWSTARELARSGTCAGWRDIERRLMGLGYPGASQHWSESFRSVLDRLCAAAGTTARNSSAA